MQRRPTKNTRGPNSAEKRFQGWIKHRPCCWCGSESGSIVDHAKGATLKHNKVLIGHWFVLPNCLSCDDKKTREGKKLGNYSEKWLALQADYEYERGEYAPYEVNEAIRAWGETWQNGG